MRLPARAAARTYLSVKPEETSPFRPLVAYYRPYLGPALRMLFFYVFQHAFVWFSPVLMGLLVDLTTQPPGAQRMHRFWVYGGLLMAMALWNLPASLLRTLYQSRITRGVSRDLRMDLCRQIQQLSLLFHDRQSVGRLHAKAIRDIEIIERLPQQFVWLVFTTSVSIAVALVTISIRVPKALVFFLVLIPISVAFQLFFDRHMEAYANRYRKKFEAMSSGLSDMMTMIAVTRAHGLEQHELSRVTERIKDVFTSGRKFDILVELFGASSWVTFTVVQTIFLLGSVYYCFRGALTVGDVVIFNAFSTTISWSLLGLVQTLPVVAQARDSMKSILELLQAPDLEQNQGKPAPGAVQGGFQLEDVCYSYPATEHHAVRGITMDIPAGTSVAFVGPSGAGKSTMLALLLGFIRPARGRILLDGQDMNGLDMRAYRQFVGVVTQDVVFFSGSILENIAYGIAGITEADVRRALEQANALEFVEQLPEGLHTRLKEDGIKLSGGQHQRLAIARALIRDPRVLILDEATSALDIEAEVIVQQALKKVMANRTCIVVAHRLSTVRICDRIAVLEQGHLARLGTHAELLQSENFYSRVVRATM